VIGVTLVVPTKSVLTVRVGVPKIIARIRVATIQKVIIVQMIAQEMSTMVIPPIVVETSYRGPVIVAMVGVWSLHPTKTVVVVKW
jgi:hypothetical protein